MRRTPGGLHIISWRHLERLFFSPAYVPFTNLSPQFPPPGVEDYDEHCVEQNAFCIEVRDLARSQRTQGLTFHSTSYLPPDLFRNRYRRSRSLFTSSRAYVGSLLTPPTSQTASFIPFTLISPLGADTKFNQARTVLNQPPDTVPRAPEFFLVTLFT